MSTDPNRSTDTSTRSGVFPLRAASGSTDPNRSLGQEASLPPELIERITRVTVDALNREYAPRRRRAREVFILGMIVGAASVVLLFTLGARSAMS